MALLDIEGRRGPWFCEGLLPQYSVMPGQGLGVGGLVSSGREDGLGGSRGETGKEDNI